MTFYEVVNFIQVIQAVMILTGSGVLLAVQEEGMAQKAKKHTDKLNALVKVAYGLFCHSVLDTESSVLLVPGFRRDDVWIPAFAGMTCYGTFYGVDKLNAFLMNKARSSGDINYLASPVTGGGIAVGRFQQLFLVTRSQGKKQPAERAEFVWQVLAAQGQRILKEGKALETAEENLAELAAQAAAFAEKQLPILKALGIA